MTNPMTNRPKPDRMKRTGYPVLFIFYNQKEAYGMEITWLGHACFLLEEQGYRIVIDPYEGVAGYPPLQVSAHAVF